MASRKKNGSPSKKKDRADQDFQTSERQANPLGAQKGRQSEYAVSRGGMNQESRQHNKSQPDS